MIIDNFGNGIGILTDEAEQMLETELAERQTVNLLCEMHKETDKENGKAWMHGNIEFYVPPIEGGNVYLIKYEDNTVFGYAITPVDDSGFGVNIEISVIENFSESWLK